MLGEDALDGGPSEVEAQVFECAAKPRVAPRRILARHREQLLDLVTPGGWTARTPAGTTPVVLRSDLLAVPPKDGLRRRERRHLGQKLSAEGLSFLGEQPSLGIGEAKTLGPEAGLEHAVLGAQLLYRFALSATDPAGDQQNDELKRSGGCHGRRTITPRRGARSAQWHAFGFGYTTTEVATRAEHAAERRLRAAGFRTVWRQRSRRLDHRRRSPAALIPKRGGATVSRNDISSPEGGPRRALERSEGSRRWPRRRRSFRGRGCGEHGAARRR
jgi:hypothetical protein